MTEPLVASLSVRLRGTAMTYLASEPIVALLREAADRIERLVEAASSFSGLCLPPCEHDDCEHLREAIEDRPCRDNTALSGLPASEVKE